MALNGDIKRVYSLNLASYLRLKNHKEEYIANDENGKVYFVFGDAEKDVQAYREDELIQGFIREYKRVRDDIRRFQRRNINE